MAKINWRGLLQKAYPHKSWTQDKGLYVTLGEEGTIGTPTAYMLVDLSDITNFKHASIGAIVVDWVDFQADIMSGTWNAHFGVVTELDGSNGTVEFFHAIQMEKATNHNVERTPPGGVNLKVVGGVPAYLLTNHKLEGDTLIQNDVYLVSPAGSAIPAVGDLVLYMEEETAGESAEPELLVSGEHAMVQLSWNMALSEVVE